MVSYKEKLILQMLAKYGYDHLNALLIDGNGLAPS